MRVWTFELPAKLGIPRSTLDSKILAEINTQRFKTI
jgi:hypothetical protein